MNGEMVATSPSASGEVALEKTEWLRKVTVKDGRVGRLRLAQRKREEYHTAS